MPGELLYVSTLRSNAKGEAETSLTRKTLLVGKNHRGKSRVVEALSLALTGQGRSEGLGKAERDLMTLKPSAARSLYATATITATSGEDVGEASWRCTGNLEKSSRAEWTVSAGLEKPVGAFVLDAAAGLLKGDQKRLRTAIVEHVGGKVTDTDLQRFVTPDLWDRMSGLLGERDEQWPVGLLLQVSGDINDRLRTTRKDLKEATRQLEDVPSSLTDAETTELHTLLARSKEPQLSAVEKQELRKLQHELQTQLHEQDARVAVVQASASAADDSLVTKLAAIYEAQRSVITTMTLNGMTTARCGVCFTTGVPIESYQAAAERVGSALAEARAAQSSLQELESETLKANNLRAKLEQVFARLEEDSTEPVNRERLRELSDRYARSEQYRSVGERHAVLDRERVTLETLRDGVKRAIKTLLDERVEAFEAGLTAALPEGTTCQLALREGRREVCRLKLGVGGAEPIDYRALCGAEKAGLLSAFAAVVSRGQRDAIRLLVLDDVWLDSESLTEVLTSIGASVSSGLLNQAIVCAVDYDRDPPDGWSCVRLP